MTMRLLFVISLRKSFNSLDNFIVSISNFLLFVLRTALLVPTLELLLVGVSSKMQQVFHKSYVGLQHLLQWSVAGSSIVGRHRDLHSNIPSTGEPYDVGSEGFRHLQ
jgi:hypothetical protein